MHGPIAKWYASTTRKSMRDFETLADRIAGLLPAGARVLDVAPGPGYFSIELAKRGDFQITGLDISRTFVEIAHRNAREAGVTVDFRHGNASGMPLRSESFDFILCRAAFKNFAQPVAALNEMYRTLVKGGRALIIDLRRDAPEESIEEAVGAMGLDPVNRAITRWTFRHMLLKRAYTRDDFQCMTAESKFWLARVDEVSIGLEVWLTR